jgi:hypothetical protein
MSHASPKIVSVSDVSLGYGSPQILTLTKSLQNFYGNASATIFEPDQSERASRFKDYDGIRIKRIFTSFHPHNMEGKVQYINQVTDYINAVKPDLVLICNPILLPILFKLTYRPKLTMYYMLESLSLYLNAGGWYDQCMLTLHKQAAPLIDMLIFPEENRAVAEMELLPFDKIPVAIFYNVSHNHQTTRDIATIEERRPCILYSGTIETGSTFAEYYSYPEISHIPIDMFGYFTGADRERLKEALFNSKSQVAYKGYIDSADLNAIRKYYAYSICMWAPTTNSQLYAAPNKFFEAIADGVPPIVAPHPQCKMLVERYECGILMKDWSFDAFKDAVNYAMDIFGTQRYQKLVENCQKAVLHELNVDVQFEKVKRLLPASL